jgi:hypothetical protein
LEVRLEQGMTGLVFASECKNLAQLKIPYFYLARVKQEGE